MKIYYGETPVHPHVRGEHVFLPLLISSIDGSSPRTWGTHQGYGILFQYDRFIPTYVGNTGSVSNFQLMVTVHPHVRGEHSALELSLTVSCGSSPRTWGTPWMSRFMPKGQRFIPTYVGNTCINNASHAIRTVHPHVRGEHFAGLNLALNVDGSSPRTWGTHIRKVLSRAQKRFIPTYVGNTPEERPGAVLSTVHPHVRGEHYSRYTKTDQQSGSSPRTWGTLPGAQVAPLVFRFIPTYVGNTRRGSVGASTKTVHPHVRGEHY